MLDFADRTGCGTFTVLWPQMGKGEASAFMWTFYYTAQLRRALGRPFLLALCTTRWTGAHVATGHVHSPTPHTTRRCWAQGPLALGLVPGVQGHGHEGRLMLEAGRRRGLTGATQRDPPLQPCL